MSIINNKIFELTKSISTPFYLYSLDMIEERLSKITSSLISDINLYYSVKSNPHPAIIALLKNDRRVFFDVSTDGELKLLLDLGVCSERISYVGPGKSVSDLVDAVENKVGCLILESLDELTIVQKICESKKNQLNVKIRVNTEFIYNTKNRKVRNKSGVQFGMSIDELQSTLTVIESDQYLNFKGFHFQSPSMNLDHEAIINNFSYFLGISSENYNRECRVQIAAGLGVPFLGEEELDFDFVCRGINSLAKKNNNALSIEMGRYLVGPAGYYIVKVLNKKSTYGENVIVVDGGLNSNLALVGHGQLFRKNNSVYSLTGKGENIIATVYGSTCSPLDVLAVNVSLPECKVGDYLVFESCGAYGQTYSPQGFMHQRTSSEITF